MANILVIDDEQHVRESLDLVLSRAGHRVAVAANGLEALAQLRRSAADLVICDMLMPVVAGADTITAIYRDFPQTRVIAISGMHGSERGNLLGMVNRLCKVRCFAKPFSVKELLQAVEEALASTARISLACEQAPPLTRSVLAAALPA